MDCPLLSCLGQIAVRACCLYTWVKVNASSVTFVTFNTIGYFVMFTSLENFFQCN